MAIQDTIDSMEQNLSNAYGAVEDMGGTIPQNANLANLGNSILSIPTGGSVTSVNTQTGDVVLDADDIDDTSTTNKFVTASDKTAWDGKSVVSVSDTGTATDEVEYITINGVEKKIKSGGGGSSTPAEEIHAYDRKKTLPMVWEQYTGFSGMPSANNISNMWSDGVDIYWSDPSNSRQLRLNRETKTFETMTWGGSGDALNAANGTTIFNNGKDIFSLQYYIWKLNVSTHTWSQSGITIDGSNHPTGLQTFRYKNKTFASAGNASNYSFYELPDFSETFTEKNWTLPKDKGCNYFWTDGRYLYLDNTYVYDEAKDDWDEITWGIKGDISTFSKSSVCYIYGDVYYITNTSPYFFKFDKTSRTFKTYTMYGLPTASFGSCVWSDGVDIYMTRQATTYRLKYNYPKGVEPDLDMVKIPPISTPTQLALDSHTSESSIELDYNKYTKFSAQNGALTITLKALPNYVPEYRAKITTVAQSAVTLPSGTTIKTNDTTNCVIVDNVATLETTQTYEINIQDGLAYIYVI